MERYHLPVTGGRMRKFYTLDGLRGVAALAVAYSHFANNGLLPKLLPRFYLAVDLFFVLSGFVIAHAYEQKLKASGYRRGWYVAARALRLGPMHVLGVVLGVGSLFAFDYIWGLAPQVIDRLEAGGQTLAFWPTVDLADPRHVNAYPANGPVWSLALELWVNLIYGFFVVSLTTGRLRWIVALAGLAVTGVAMWTGANASGGDVNNVHLGVPRVVFGFFLGVLMYRAHAAGRLKLPGLPAWLLGVLVIAALWVPTVKDNALNGLADAGLSLFALPLIVALALNGGSGDDPPTRFLARLSYPIYVCHFPFVMPFKSLMLRYGHGEVYGALGLGLAILVAVVAERWYDAPLRTWAKRFLPRSPSVAPEASALANLPPSAA